MADIIHLNDANYQSEVLEAKGVVLVDFWAPWCGPCRMLAPALEAAAEAFAGKIKVAKYNVDEAQDVAGQLGIRSIPTLIVYRDGEPIDQHLGAMSQAQLTAYLNQFI